MSNTNGNTNPDEALEAAKARLMAAKAGSDPEELRDASQALADLRAQSRLRGSFEGTRSTELSINVDTN